MPDAIEKLLVPPGAQDHFTRAMIEEMGYIGAKRLPDGRYVGMQRLMFTLAICLDVTQTSPFARRYCYENASDALANFDAIETLDCQPWGYIASPP